MYLPFWFSFVNFINAGIWIAYSVICKIDLYVLVVNVVGALACAIHLIILCCSAVRCLLLPKRIVPSSSVPVRNSSQCEQPRRKEANDAHTLTKRRRVLPLTDLNSPNDFRIETTAETISVSCSDELLTLGYHSFTDPLVIAKGKK
ncbi:hypothetical protein F2Q69_00032236 [Brassica cretica]|uniref:Bidirectional sugar transporter SWEET n=1 Tax=Brassica cretica TaxID=69181 RepID=A0A8S9S9I7_BRACR|nr:hypothetical protein F2Q69_00032236 [Brassica cretica]